MLVYAHVVDLESLWQTVVGTIVITCFWLAMLGSARSSESPIEGQGARAGGLGRRGHRGLLGTAIAITPGMIVVVDK